ncbi:YceI family protein [Luteirhabdus pelagi]|uniref:YceI family protein n=1 Tax=Luteirhabdus pelagi TaxID=2792783 RepID=UPI00193A9AA1|nr:YceI family protein [Luteirhabdus pelagi]
MKNKTTWYVALFLLVCTALSAQKKVGTKSGNITFEASMPSFEEVEAINENVSAILNMETGEFASLALIKGFRFKRALMEEHFNENYMESHTYPKAVFKGSIDGFISEALSSSEQRFVVIGKMTIHGIEKEISIPIYVTRLEEGIQLTTKFTLLPEDFGIEIPSVVSNKIADEVVVEAHYILK